MFKEKGNVSVINKVLISMLAIICVLAVSIILLTQLNKKNIKTYVKETQGMIVNYATTEENTWDVSTNGDGSVIATLSEDGTLTISGSGLMKDFSSSENIKDILNNTKIRKVIIKNGVASIGSNAFRGCSSLIKIEVDDSNTNYMDDNGVLYTKDKSTIIKYPEAKEEITYIIPEGVTNIGSVAFLGCSNLTSIEISSSVTDIGNNAFYVCKNLMIICEIDSTAHNYSKENKIDYLATRYRKVNNYFKGIQLGIAYENFINSIDTNMEYNVTENSEKIAEKTLIKTGQQLVIDDRTFSLVVTGDCNGDGQADLKDILGINKHRLNKVNLVDEYLLAGDVNEDDKSDLKDILQINKYRLGKISEL